MANAMYGKAGVVAVALVLGAAIAPAQAGAGGGSQSSPTTAPGGTNSTNGGLASGGALTNAPGSGASVQDKDFLKGASQGGMFEIQAGKLAAQKGNSEDVKQFGQMMVTDHTKLNEQMTPVLTEAGVKPATSLPGKEKKELAKLQGLSGDAFDKEYITAMVKDHEEDKKAFQSEAANGQLPSEKSAAMQGEGMIDTHLEKIKQVAQAHNVTQS